MEPGKENIMAFLCSEWFIQYSFESGKNYVWIFYLTSTQTSNVWWRNRKDISFDAFYACNTYIILLIGFERSIKSREILQSLVFRHCSVQTADLNRLWRCLVSNIITIQSETSSSRALIQCIIPDLIPGALAWNLTLPVWSKGTSPSSSNFTSRQHLKGRSKSKS